jgi:hypothetical protein
MAAHREYDREACAEHILERLRQGDSLRAICNAEDMPAASTFLDWCDADPALLERYSTATQLGYDLKADEALEEAEKARKAEEVPAARLAFDARRWWLGKRAPKKYGDRMDLNHSGSINLGNALDAIPDA